MTRQELESKTVVELTAICKEKNLTYYKGKKKLNKSEMIEKIMCSEDDKADIVKKIDEAGIEENVIEANNDSKKEYIETAQIGTLVAFREPDTNKLNTAKVVKKSTKNKKLMLKTQYGAEFIVPYEFIVWVKTGSRWPKGIYNELKGIR